MRRTHSTHHFICCKRNKKRNRQAENQRLNIAFWPCKEWEKHRDELKGILKWRELALAKPLDTGMGNQRIGLRTWFGMPNHFDAASIAGHQWRLISWKRCIIEWVLASCIGPTVTFVAVNWSSWTCDWWETTDKIISLLSFVPKKNEENQLNQENRGEKKSWITNNIQKLTAKITNVFFSHLVTKQKIVYLMYVCVREMKLIAKQKDANKHAHSRRKVYFYAFDWTNDRIWLVDIFSKILNSRHHKLFSVLKPILVAICLVVFPSNFFYIYK